MHRKKLICKFIPILLIVSILFSACDVPDISEFTEQSATMTSSIRAGIKDTGDLLKEASLRKDLFQANEIVALRKHSENYQAVMKPTMATLNSLDNYLETLNEISKANKESGENAEAIVGSVGSLVTSASSMVLSPSAAIGIPDTVVKVATGVLGAFEQFRTARSFKKRVNLASEIIEGRPDKNCTLVTKDKITKISTELAETIKTIEQKPLPREAKEIQKQLARDRADIRVNSFGCGIMDLLKFTISDLKKINSVLSPLIITNYRQLNRRILDYYTDMDHNEGSYNQGAYLIEKFRRQTLIIVGNENQKIARKTLEGAKRNLKGYLNDMLLDAPQFSEDIIGAIAVCNSTTCIGMNEFLEFKGDPAKNPDFENLIRRIPDRSFYVGIRAIENVLIQKDQEILAEKQAYNAKRELNNLNYQPIKAEIARLTDSQKKLDALLNKSVEAIDIWINTHANMRSALNEKQTLSVSMLAAKIKEIVAILDSKNA